MNERGANECIYSRAAAAAAAAPEIDAGACVHKSALLLQMGTALVTDNLPSDRRTDFPLESTYVCVYVPHLQSGYCTADLTHDDIPPGKCGRCIEICHLLRSRGRAGGRAEWAGRLSDTNHLEEFPMCRARSASDRGGS